MVSREAVVIENRDGLRLFGVLHRPEPETEKEVAIIFLSPGVKSRVGPHGLYNKMKNTLLDQGYTVLQYDFYGLGDSEGDLEERYLAELYASIESGRYVEDALCAIDWMQNHVGKKEFILAGLCGGALTGLVAAARDQRVKGVLSLGLPVAQDKMMDATRFMTKGQLDDIGKSYFRKLIKPDAWLRLLTFKTDYRLLLKAVVQRVIGKRRTKPPKKSVIDAETTNLNPLVASAFNSFLESGGKLLLIFSGADRLAWEFDEKFAQPYAEKLEQLQGYEVHTIPKANHILSDSKWLTEMQCLADEWIKRHF